MSKRATAVFAWLCGVAWVAGNGPVASAQDDAVLELYFGGAERLLDDETDAGLAGVWELAGDRLREVPAEVRSLTDEPLAGLDVAMSLLRRLRFADLYVRGRIDFEDEEPVFGLAMWPRDGGDARGVVDDVRESIDALRGGPAFEESDRGGFWRMEGPRDRSLFLGSDDRGGSEAVVIALGEEMLGAGEGAEREGIFGGVANLRALDVPRELIDQPAVEGVLRHLGLFGDEAWRVEWDVARERGKLVARTRLVDVRTLAGRFGVERGTALNMEVLRAVPRDATWVMAGAYDFSGLPEVIRGIARSAGMTEEELEGNEAYRMGMGFVSSFTDALGDDVVVYRSLTTGGGDVLSTVMSVGVEDADALRLWMDRVSGLGSGAAAMALRGYVTVQKSEEGESVMWSVRTTGVPLPVDVTFGLGGGRLTIGLTSSAVRAGMAQLDGGGLSVLERADFREPMGPALGGDVGVVSVQWRDMGWHAERSYGIASLVGAAAANGVRGRFGGTRDPGVVVPGYASFVDDVDPVAGWSYWEGEDLVGYMESDGSFLLNVAVGAREVLSQQFVSVVPAMVGTMLPALRSARQTAVEVRSAMELRRLAATVIAYATEHDGRLPGSVNELRRAGYEAALESPYGRAEDGGPGLAFRGDLGSLDEIERPWEVMLAIDRTMYLDPDQDMMNVAFADGRVQTMTWMEFVELLDEPQNEGALDAWGVEAW